MIDHAASGVEAMSVQSSVGALEKKCGTLSALKILPL